MGTTKWDPKGDEKYCGEIEDIEKVVTGEVQSSLFGTLKPLGNPNETSSKVPLISKEF